MLSEISCHTKGQMLNGRTYMKYPEESEFTETESRAVTRDLGEGETDSWHVRGTECQSRETEKVLEMVGGDGGPGE